MKRLGIVSAVVALATLFVFSCATPPEAPEPEPEAEAPLPIEEQAPEPTQLRSEAEELRDTIIELGLDQYAAQEFEDGEAAYEEALAFWGEDNERAAAAFERAIASYEQGIEAGIGDLRQAKVAEAMAARDRADTMKAPVAVPGVYQQGVESFRSAETSMDNQRYRDGIEAYDQATEQFETAYEQALEKRNRAEQAMQRSTESIDSTERQVRDLEQELEDFEPEIEEETE